MKQTIQELLAWSGFPCVDADCLKHRYLILPTHDIKVGMKTIASLLRHHVTVNHSWGCLRCFLIIKCLAISKWSRNKRVLLLWENTMHSHFRMFFISSLDCGDGMDQCLETPHWTSWNHMPGIFFFNLSLQFAESAKRSHLQHILLFKTHQGWLHITSTLDQKSGHIFQGSPVGTCTSRGPLVFSSKLSLSTKLNVDISHEASRSAFRCRRYWLCILRFMGVTFTELF